MPTHRSLSPSREDQQRLRLTLVGTVPGCARGHVPGPVRSSGTPPAPAKTPPMTASAAAARATQAHRRDQANAGHHLEDPVEPARERPVPAHAPRTGKCPPKGLPRPSTWVTIQPAPALPTPPAKETGPVAPAQPQHIGLATHRSRSRPEMPGKARREGWRGPPARRRWWFQRPGDTQVRTVSGPRSSTGCDRLPCGGGYLVHGQCDTGRGHRDFLVSSLRRLRAEAAKRA